MFSIHICCMCVNLRGSRFSTKPTWTATDNFRSMSSRGSASACDHCSTGTSSARVKVTCHRLYR